MVAVVTVWSVNVAMGVAPARIVAHGTVVVTVIVVMSVGMFMRMLLISMPMSVRMIMRVLVVMVVIVGGHVYLLPRAGIATMKCSGRLAKLQECDARSCGPAGRRRSRLLLSTGYSESIRIAGTDSYPGLPDGAGIWRKALRSDLKICLGCMFAPSAR